MQQTLIYLSIMAAGICVGALLRKREKILKEIDWLTIAAVCVLVLLLGLWVGANDDVRSNLGRVGLRALVVGVGAMIGSVALSVVVYRVWFRHVEYEE